jgi:hypothetical protein
VSAQHVAQQAKGGDGRVTFSGILLSVILALAVVSTALATSSASSEVFVGASQKARFRLTVNTAPRARLVVRFTSLAIRRRIRNEKIVVAYCSWGRLGTSVSQIKLRKSTAVAQVTLNHPKAARPSMCGLRSVLATVKTRNGHTEYLRLVAVRMRRVSS